MISRGLLKWKLEMHMMFENKLKIDFAYAIWLKTV